MSSLRKWCATLETPTECLARAVSAEGCAWPRLTWPTVVTRPGGPRPGGQLRGLLVGVTPPAACCFTSNSISTRVQQFPLVGPTESIRGRRPLARFRPPNMLKAWNFAQRDKYTNGTGYEWNLVAVRIFFLVTFKLSSFSTEPYQELRKSRTWLYLWAELEKG